MIFNSWTIVYGADGTLGIAETIMDGFCFPAPLLDSKEQNTFMPTKQEFFSSNHYLYQINTSCIAYSILVPSELGVVLSALWQVSLSLNDSFREILAAYGAYPQTN